MTPDRTRKASGHGDKEERTRERAIAALLTAARLEDAAQRCGVSRSTLCRWLREPSFEAAFKEARRQVLEVAVSRLQAVTAEAVEALSRNLTCRRAAIEVQAARTVLELATRSVELLDMEERVRQLEAAVQQRTGGAR